MRGRFSVLRTFYLGLTGNMNEANSFIAERDGSSCSNKRSYSSYSSGYSSSSSENSVKKYFKRDLNTSSSKYTRVNSNKMNYYSSSSSSSESYSTGSRSFSSSNNGGFKKDRDGRVDIYTDGACTSNGSKNARAGIGVYFGDDHPSNVSKPVQGRITNNSAEIEAVIEAAKVAKDNGINKIRINTDSQFLINCQTKWMNKWKATGWVTSKKEPVSNREELQKMDRVLSELDVEFNHVRGHKGVYGNEMADKLARAGAKQSK
ncbi:Similar to Rnaseh1: Ribonuclease H1 (Rattus norvegicus) [Cotesia congregata]|uniref:Ribonuclease H1 n=1 Tax=Cotesia congregata TaxID=51543 RepID=A0A8J2HAZ7_COTCN|nr:Similar to Rnaseh1: Ribonuclease H1 (Rattus norvegicus) [Cotesia congregata]